MDFDSAKLQNTPPTVYYIKNFISPTEESDILRNVYSAPKPKWTVLQNRRLQEYGGVHTAKGMIRQKIPAWLENYCRKIDNLHVFGLPTKQMNHVLINEYESSQGIMPHTDGPVYEPVVTTISCGSHTVLNFHENSETRHIICKVFLEPRSLICIKDDLYTNYLHSIEECRFDHVNSEEIGNFYLLDDLYKNCGQIERGTRVSLTIRSAKHVLFNLTRFL